MSKRNRRNRRELTQEQKNNRQFFKAIEDGKMKGFWIRERQWSDDELCCPTASRIGLWDGWQKHQKLTGPFYRDLSEWITAQGFQLSLSQAGTEPTTLGIDGHGISLQFPFNHDGYIAAVCAALDNTVRGEGE
jgi:hypothetical protein